MLNGNCSNSSPILHTQRIRAWRLRRDIAADAFDRHGRFREAFRVSSASKNHLRALWRAPTTRVTELAHRIADYLESCAQWSAGATHRPQMRPRPRTSS